MSWRLTKRPFGPGLTSSRDGISKLLRREQQDEVLFTTSDTEPSNLRSCAFALPLSTSPRSVNLAERRANRKMLPTNN